VFTLTVAALVASPRMFTYPGTVRLATCLTYPVMRFNNSNRIRCLLNQKPPHATAKTQREGCSRRPGGPARSEARAQSLPSLAAA